MIAQVGLEGLEIRSQKIFSGFYSLLGPYYEYP